MTQKQFPFGFTLIELLLSVTLITLIVSFSIPFYQSLQTKNSLSLSASAVTQSLREARLRAQAMEGDSPWGVFVEEGAVVLFKGQNYAARDLNSDQIFYLSRGIEPSGIEELVFSKLTGYPSQTGNITLAHSSDHFIQIHINEKGMAY